MFRGKKSNEIFPRRRNGRVWTVFLLLITSSLAGVNFLAPYWWEPLANLVVMGRPETARADWVLKLAAVSPKWPIAPGNGPQIRFTDAAEQAGIEVLNGMGACWGDYDGDLYPDLFVATSGVYGFDESKVGLGSFLYRNVGGEGFSDVTALAGVKRKVNAFSCAWGDLNDDGLQDLVVGVGFSGNTLLYLNQGDGTFRLRERAFESERKSWFTHGIALGDANGDGRLDVYLSNSIDPSKLTGLNPQERSERSGSLGTWNRLYLNGGGATFREVSREEGAPAGLEGGEGWAAVFFDGDLDGDADLVATNDYLRDQFYINLGGGRFKETVLGMTEKDRKKFSGPGFPAEAVDLPSRRRTPWASSCMGMAVGDFDNDLWPDLYCSQVSNDRLYRNLHDGTFERVPDRLGPGWATHGLWGMGVAPADFDNDGDLDVLVANGSIAHPPRAQRFVLLQNKGGGEFADVTATAGPALRGERHSEGAAWADYDLDGDVDVFISTDDGRGSLLLRNDTEGVGRWVGVRLAGAASARDAIGASVFAKTRSGTQLRQRIGGSGLYSCDGAQIHFGLGRETLVEELKVLWPSGKSAVYRGLEAGAYHDVVENGEKPMDGSAAFARSERKGN